MHFSTVLVFVALLILGSVANVMPNSRVFRATVYPNNTVIHENLLNPDAAPFIQQMVDGVLTPSLRAADAPDATNTLAKRGDSKLNSISTASPRAICFQGSRESFHTRLEVLCCLGVKQLSCDTCLAEHHILIEEYTNPPLPGCWGYLINTFDCDYAVDTPKGYLNNNDVLLGP